MLKEMRCEYEINIRACAQGRTPYPPMGRWIKVSSMSPGVPPQWGTKANKKVALGGRG